MSEFYAFIVPLSMVPIAAYTWWNVVFRKKAANVALAMGVLWPLFLLLWLVKGFLGAVVELIQEAFGGESKSS